jgi:hypothetical protein
LGGSVEVFLTCTTGFAVASGDLTIVLTSNRNQIDFDNVTLSVVTPEPSAVLLKVAGLALVALLSTGPPRSGKGK